VDWSPKIKPAIAEFHNSGQWQRNYDLIKLKATSYQIKHATPNDELVIAKLKHWEIYTLEISKHHKLVGSEEF